jgi:predicted nucleic acid-binding protein
MEDLLNRARNGELELYLHVIHLGEVYYITVREQGQDPADLAYHRIKNFPLKLIDVIDEELLLTACALKARFPISYVDSFAAALAQLTNSSLLTGDPELEILEEAGIITLSRLG